MKKSDVDDMMTDDAKEQFENPPKQQPTVTATEVVQGWRSELAGATTPVPELVSVLIPEPPVELGPPVRSCRCGETLSLNPSSATSPDRQRTIPLESPNALRSIFWATCKCSYEAWLYVPRAS